MKEGFPFCGFIVVALLVFLRMGFRFTRECFGDGQHEKLAARFFMALEMI